MILFRADGNKEIGTGHIMRCLSLADAFNSLGELSEFVTADDNMKSLINARGYTCNVLRSDFSDMDTEVEALLRLDSFKTAKMIIVDSYYASDDYLYTLSAHKKTAYINDYLTLRPVAVYINYNVFADSGKITNRKEGIKSVEIMGPKYAPLRRDFQDLKAIEIKEVAGNILFLAGGSDPLHVALNFAKEIVKHSDDNHYNIVVGSLSEDLEAIKDIADKSQGRIEVKHNVNDMKSLMTSSDLAVSAAGSTLYELCACGVPTINYILADNQRLISESFRDKGVMLSAGDVRDNPFFYDNLYSMITDLSKDPKKRRELSERAHNLVDGNGARRLAIELEEIIK